MPSTASRRAAVPSPAPGVTRLSDREVNFQLLEDPDGLVLVDGGLPGHGEPFAGTPADAAAQARNAGPR